MYRVPERVLPTQRQVRRQYMTPDVDHRHRPQADRGVGRFHGRRGHDERRRAAGLAEARSVDVEIGRADKRFGVDGPEGHGVAKFAKHLQASVGIVGVQRLGEA